MNKPPKQQIFNGIKFTRDDRTGYYLSTVRVKNGKRQRMHVYVWEYYFSDVPKGCHIHHINGDRADNRIENLAAIPGVEHTTYHAKKHAKEDPHQIMESLAKAREVAKMWHSSEDGEVWHKAHFQRMKEKLYQKRLYVCQWCGKVFESSKSGAKFCCNKCRSAARRNSHVDDEIRFCSKCGAAFSINRYYTQTKCPECRGRWR